MMVTQVTRFGSTTRQIRPSIQRESVKRESCREIAVFPSSPLSVDLALLWTDSDELNDADSIYDFTRLVSSKER
jgi:hypothetical protein